MNLILIPLMTAFLAWFISWSFIKLLFFPHKKINLFGCQWEGALYPLIQSIQLDQLIAATPIDKQIEQVIPFIDAKLDDFFKNRLAEKLPMISMFIGDKTIAQLKGVFIEELSSLFPSLINQFSASLLADFNANFKQKLAPKLETIVLKATAKFRIAALLMGILWGFLINWVISLF